MFNFNFLKIRSCSLTVAIVYYVKMIDFPVLGNFRACLYHLYVNSIHMKPLKCGLMKTTCATVAVTDDKRGS